MRWTIYYCLMTCCLIATLCATLFGSTEFWNTLEKAQGTLASNASASGIDVPIVITKSTKPVLSSIEESPAAPKAPAVTATVAAAPLARHIEAGTMRNEVLELLGQPSQIDAKNDRWTYGNEVLMFKNDRVIGSVTMDPSQAELAANADSRTFTSLASTSNAASSKSARQSTSSSRKTSYRRSSSSKKATVWEPMFRKFYSDTPLPRNKKHWSRYNGMPGYRDHQYSPRNSIFRRY